MKSAAAFGACTALSDRNRLSAPLHGGDYRRACGYSRSLSCQSYSRAGRELDEFRLTNAKATNQKVLLLREIGRVVLDPSVSDEQLRQTIYQHVPADKLWQLSKNAIS